jgi:hypothetical protein
MIPRLTTSIKRLVAFGIDPDVSAIRKIRGEGRAKFRIADDSPVTLEASAIFLRPQAGTKDAN